LESCRAPTMLGDLEDDEDMEDDENDDENEDEYEEVGNTLLQVMVSRNLLSFMDDESLETRLAAAAVGKRKSWDDEFVLKRQFSALIPAFDPRPGRTNINQTTDIKVPPPEDGKQQSDSSESEAEVEDVIACGSANAPGASTSTTNLLSQPSLYLVLRGPNLAGVPDCEVPLIYPDWTIFRAVQELMQMANMTKQDKYRKIWEPTYTIIYREAPNKDDNNYSDAGILTPVVSIFSGGFGAGRSGSICGSTTLSPTSPLPPSSPTTTLQHCSVDDVLELLSQLSTLNTALYKKNVREKAMSILENVPSLNPEQFMSKKITNKLQQQIQDPLVLSSNSLPSWCEDLNQSCPFLFPFETRQLYFNCTAFGASRSIVWLQSQRDVTLERQRTPGISPRHHHSDQHEFRVGRLKHERVKVPRSDKLLEWAQQVLKLHCNRKSVLEVEFLGEEGTGLGPTLEFYALVAAELQRADLAMWLCDDHHQHDMMDSSYNEDDNLKLRDKCNDMMIDLGEGNKPAGFYVRRTAGLFLAPLPQDSEICARVSKLFWFLGVFLAKVLQDGRLVDLPLSNSFLQLLCHNKILSKKRVMSSLISNKQTSGAAGGSSTTTTTNDDLMMSSLISEESDLMMATNKYQATANPDSLWYDGVLTQDNLQEIDPVRAEFIKELQGKFEQKS
jgi:E3 ubiquitin-protein ligase HECTD1